jgi:transketolase
LGQGFSNAIGMAIAHEYLAKMFNKDDIKILDHYIYGICSDGDLMEGVSHEAASLAGHLKLGKIIFFYDDNSITIDGSTSLAFSENVGKRFEGYGWQVLHINDVNDLKQIDNAVVAAQKETSKPTLIITKTHIGYGSPNKQDTASVHGSPLGEEEVKRTKENLNWPTDKSFLIPEEVIEYFKPVQAKGNKQEKEWNKRFENYKAKYPKEAALFNSVMNGDFGDNWKDKLPSFDDSSEKVATRAVSGKVLNSIAASLPTLIGGSADLAPSNNTMLNDYKKFTAENRSGRNFHFGIREHGMGSILNGMAIYGGVIPYGGTFLIFSDYMRPSIRLASLSGIKAIYVFTHDSVGLGEDGPTHQPIEHIASLRAIPGVLVIRPADANETVKAWEIALEHEGSPVALLLTRQKLPVIDRIKYAKADNLKMGAYIVKDAGEDPDVILMATGSEIGVTLEAAEKLEELDIRTRVVSFPCWELFEKQSADYKENVFPSSVKARVSVEAGVKQGWEKYVGEQGDFISIEKFGASAPYQTIFDNYGFTVDDIVATTEEVFKKVKQTIE